MHADCFFSGSVEQSKVMAPTRAGRALRRSLLKGCVIGIVVAGYSGKRFIYERAHELGVRCASGTLKPTS
jgi:hypothetical protein